MKILGDSRKLRHYEATRFTAIAARQAASLHNADISMGGRVTIDEVIAYPMDDADGLMRLDLRRLNLRCTAKDGYFLLLGMRLSAK